MLQKYSHILIFKIIFSKLKDSILMNYILINNLLNKKYNLSKNRIKYFKYKIKLKIISKINK